MQSTYLFSLSCLLPSNKPATSPMSSKVCKTVSNSTLLLQCVLFQLAKYCKMRRTWSNSNPSYSTIYGWAYIVGERPNCKITRWIICQMLYHSFGLQTLAWLQLFVMTGKKVAFKLHIWISAPPPLCPPRIHLASTSRPPQVHLTSFTWWCSQTSVFLLVFRSCVLL